MSVAGRGSRARKRRRRLQASMFALVLPLSLGPGWALWAAIPWASGRDQGPQRRLLGILVQVRPGLLGLGESGMMSGNAGASPPHSPNQCPGGGARSRPCWEEPPKSRKGWAKGAWVSSQGATAGKGLPDERAAWEEVGKKEGAGLRGQMVILNVQVRGLR